ncbi:MAG: SEC-C domain-containing protein, partial [Clostridia bacterium]|nr:SEC-C domain-containing protein [Clostridia bacterium]
MSLYETWQQVAQSQRTRDEYDAFWGTYFEAEKQNYKKILANHETVFSGKLSEVAAQFDMDPVTFTGFLDGANTSFKNGELDLESLTEDSEIALDFDFDRLYINMHNAKA